ncbi:MAG: hypothetical protein HOD92_06655 [Deltaproteobacteria bacterium]|jgi:hypothetical protein|nr:hypothetical protein [Deltaproteobacteria bacterium]
MQPSIIRPNPPFPDDMAMILFWKLIKKLCRAIKGQTKDEVAIGVEEKLKHLKMMLDKNLITKEHYSIAVEMLLAEYIKSHPGKNEKNTLNEFEKYIL